MKKALTQVLMKKSMLTLLWCMALSFASAPVRAAPNAAGVDIFTITTKDTKLSASLDGKFDITLYLKYHTASAYRGDVYSVSGWYYYDKYKNKIALVGYYLSGELHLFHSNNQSFKDKVLAMAYAWRDYAASGSAQGVAHKNRSKWQEYLVLSPDEPTKNIWQNKTKQLSIVHTHDDLRAHRSKQYLTLGNASFKSSSAGSQQAHTDLDNTDLDNTDLDSIDLDNLGVWQYGLKLEAYKRTQAGTDVLASFDNMGNINPNGRCGAGANIGFVHFKFDAQNQLQALNDVLTQSCTNSIETEQLKRLTNTQGKPVKYIYTLDDDGEAKRVVVDFVNAVFHIQRLKNHKKTP